MNKPVPIKKIDSVELLPTERTGVFHVQVLDREGKKDLSWDRFVRLKAAADAIKELVPRQTPILDVGGYDGALALFLPEYELDLIDPATTGASLLHEPVSAQAYELVASVDVLEHIVPADRRAALKELTRVSRRYIVLNYPCRQTREAQELALKLTNNALVKEHVQWDLPDTDWVLETMAEFGWMGRFVAHSSLAVWAGQYLMLNLAPEAAKELNRYLIENHADEPFKIPLYHLAICEKTRS